ncbi:MAG: acyltransferase family protein [Phycisphaerales bacterium]
MMLAMRGEKPPHERPYPPMQTPTQRHTEIDWLRVIALSLLIGYHAGMPFVSWGWHISDPNPSTGLELGMLFVNQWRLPLLFFISGAVVQASLRRRTTGAFAKDRLLRLGLPLVAGMVGLVVPLQIYIERVYKGEFSGSFFDFWPTVFTTGPYPAGNLSWHHLWYVAYVLVYSLAVVLPLRALAACVRIPQGLRRAVCSGPGIVLVGLLPIATEWWLRSAWPSTHNLTADWANHARFLWFSLLGYVLYGDERARATIARGRYVWLAATGVLYVLLYREWLSDDDTYPPVVYLVLKHMNAWLAILALLGLAQRHLTHRPRLLEWASAGVYPMYILHQTVTLGLAAVLVPLAWPTPAKWALCLLGTVAITIGLYEVLVRPWRWVRPLFGLKAGTEPEGLLNPGASGARA